MARNTVVVSITSNIKGLQKGLGQSESALSKFGKMSAAVAVAAGAVAVAVGVKAVKSASNLEQAMGGLEAVFKGSAGQMEKWATSAANNLGLAKSEYATLGTVIGSQLKNMGVASSELAGQTNSLIGMGADLAAQFGGSTSDAVSALSSLLRGERDPIERYGVSINEAAVKAKMAEMGLSGLTGEAEKNAKLQATLALLTQQTADAQGAFARESTTLAGAQQRLAAGTENLYATFGTALLPAVTAVTSAIGTLVNRMQESKWFAALTSNLTSASNAFSDFVYGILNGTGRIDFGSMFAGLLTAAVNGIQSAASWLASGGAATIVNGIIAGREAVFGAALKIFPAILEALVAAIPAIIQGIVALVTQIAGMLVTQVPIILNGAVQLFTGIVNALVQIIPPLLDAIVKLLPVVLQTLLGMIPTLLNAAIKVFTALVDALPKILPKLIAAIVALLPQLLSTIVGMIPKILQAAISLFMALVQSIPKILPQLLTAIIELAPKLVTTVIRLVPQLLKAAIELFTALVKAIPKVLPELLGAIFKMIPEIVGAVISMVPELLAAGKDIIRGLIDGIASMGQAVFDTIGGIVNGAIDWAKGLLGIHSPSKVFAEIGRFVGSGFVKGLKGSESQVRSAASSMIDKIKKGMSEGKISQTAGRAVINDIKATTRQIVTALKDRDKVLDKLSSAKDALKSIRGERRDFIAGVRDSVSELGNVAGKGSAGDMIANLEKQVRAAKRFREKIASLEKLGLDDTTRAQLLADFQQNGSTASADALLAGGKKAVQRVAELQGKLTAQGNALGRDIGDDLYNAGIKSAEGLVKGLRDQAKRLGKVADDLADSLVKKVKRKLGIKSPSRVFRSVGKYVVQGLAKGIDATAGLAVRSVDSLSNAVTNGFNPELASPVLAPSGTSLRSPSGNTYNITLQAIAPTAEAGRAIVAAIDSYERVKSTGPTGRLP